MNDFFYAAEGLRRQIESKILGLGLLARVFSRGKDPQSIQKKIDSSPGKYSLGGKLIQDCVGVRVVLYFPDDVDIVERALKGSYEYLAKDSSIDAVDENTFSVIRRNLVFKVPDEYVGDISRKISAGMPIDTTFEVQIRTVLSEGWHEVEHDLRYKCQEYWVGHSDMNRALNGVIATLETSEWSMVKIFEEMAFRHYKSKNWTGMIHSRLRMRANPLLNSKICELLDSDKEIAKQFYRIDRSLVIETIQKHKLRLPINLDNIVFLWNYIKIKNSKVSDLVPSVVLEKLSEIEA
ncbi:RelA/SpoT domain-containing protein [Pseudomonas capsici]|uniref:RelA/SpoT domain-containing protein n=1 Tax=Pseudomonas capsici TaxID=2810614 RepID=UPI0021F1A405|nr:RelA/SpoT domain-containing protein [Pseudomonas capsici]MCV4288441.1 RelA/SpoT domain-containing protein [Pseudomonas capsici]